MRSYTRCRISGATYFFTVNLAQRAENDLLTREIIKLRDAIRQTKCTHPFSIDAMVILPDHLHCLWTLPDTDADYSTRWRLIKARFSQAITADERISTSRIRRGERGIWQRRFWEHTIRNESDLINHLNYIHYNPVKHGLVSRVLDWPFSSFHRFVKNGHYQSDWGVSPDIAKAGER